MRRIQLMAAAVAIIALLGSAAPAFAVDYIPMAETTTSASSTYEAVPGTGDIKVKVTIRVRNDTPDYVESYACDEYVWDPYYYTFITVPKTCENRTRYYVKTTYLTVESNAGTIKVTSDAGKVKKQLQKPIGVSTPSSFETYELTYPKIWRGQTRTITASYVIHAGQPRNSTFHVNGAYLDFWAIAQAVDKASVKVIVPAAFETSTWGGSVTSSVKGGKRTYSSGSIADPSTFFVGVVGTNDDGFEESTLTAPSGRRIRVQGWPGDDTWIESVSREASASIVALEELVGRPIPGTGPLTLREVEGGSLGDAYIGAFDPDEQIATLSEYFDQDGTVSHEISHAWFNGSLFEANWLSEGYASWAERAVGANDTACDADLGAWASRTNTADLGTWLVADPRATQDQIDAVTEQYAAACEVISNVADEIGPDGMRDVLAVLSTAEGAYPGTTDARLGAENDWRAWLDAVDERGMLPAGKDHTAALAGILVDYGVATPDALLGREDARNALDDLRAVAGSLDLPAAVYDPMNGWDFPGATQAMGEVSSTLEGIDAVSRVLPLPGIENPLRARISTAESLPDLAELRAQVDTQLETATAVSDAIDRAFADQGPIAEVGLLGVDRAPLVETAIADVGRLDFADARTQIAALDATAAGAFSTGLMRIGGALLLVALAIGGLLWFRRRNRPAPLAVAVDVGQEEPFGSVQDAPTMMTAVPPAALDGEASSDATEPVKPRRTRRTKLREPDPGAQPPDTDSSAPPNSDSSAA